MWSHFRCNFFFLFVRNYVKILWSTLFWLAFFSILIDILLAYFTFVTFTENICFITLLSFILWNGTLIFPEAKFPRYQCLIWFRIYQFSQLIFIYFIFMLNKGSLTIAAILIYIRKALKLNDCLFFLPNLEMVQANCLNIFVTFGHFFGALLRRLVQWFCGLTSLYFLSYLKTI